MSLKIKQELKEMWPIISEVLSSGGEFCLNPNGHSMLPLIRPGIDMVTIVSPTELENDDIVLYVRESGQFVLHRLIKTKKGFCTMFGDNQKALEPKIPLKNVLAKVKYIHRDGNVIDFNSKEYKKYVKKIHRRINFYRFPVFLSKIKNKIFKKKSTSK
jgi:phage repressor protein C with HTH and peptisase S24 domain